MNPHIRPVDLSRAARILNHGPTVLVSARHDGVENVMAAAWCCALDFEPPKLTVVLDRIAHTRTLVEGSGRLVVQIPTVAQVSLVNEVGTRSLFEQPDKLAKSGAVFFEMPGRDLPFVEGCSAWLECKAISEPHIQETYDLFVAEITGAWADDRVFRDGRWNFEQADPQWRSLHHVAGGHFYIIGDAVDVARDEPKIGD
ncbi:flavin reductase family protein [Rhizobium sp. CCGE 510]|uniref:flavin reductase family protein n=1 Tax=Rhizobium sp. CCGE 510 TaxID=1132836 RepID=UPI00027B817D|nr:flavin reductase family protein [Rhizobium sp. CCGE 510]EJT04260.1 flavin reductase [Rhizobium sp. CCGE 510]